VFCWHSIRRQKSNLVATFSYDLIIRFIDDSSGALRATLYTFAASETAAADSGHGHRRMLEMRVRASVSYKRHRETLRTSLRGQTAHEHLTV